MSENAKSSEKSVPAFAQGIDVETLYFFLVLYRCGSLPKAAEQMGVSLSSANRMIAKLRDYWHDPLFERCGFQMQATTGAKERYDKVVHLLHELESLQQPDAFDPTKLERIVRIAGYDNAFTLGIASIFDELRVKLPHVKFYVSQADEDLFDNLRDDHLDMVFFARQGMHTDIHSMDFVTTPYVCVVRKGHKLERICEAGKRITKHDLADYDQVLVNAQPDRYRAPNSAANGYFNPDATDKIAMVVPFFLAVPLCLKQTDCYAIVPEATAKLTFDERDLSFLPITEKAPKLTINLGWHDRSHRDLGSQYIRSIVRECAQRRILPILSE